MLRLRFFGIISGLLSLMMLAGCITTEDKTGPFYSKKSSKPAASAANPDGTGGGAGFDEADLSFGSDSDPASAGAMDAEDSTAAEEPFPTIYFGYDDATLPDEARQVVEEVAERLKSNPGLAVQIQGHCDERGSTEYNLALGERRAATIRKYLANLGVPEARLATISYGEEYPAQEGHSEEAWAKNRRVEFVRQSYSH